MEFWHDLEVRKRVQIILLLWRTSSLSQELVFQFNQFFKMSVRAYQGIEYFEEISNDLILPAVDASADC